ncbi:MAG: hypothetical protein A3K09_01660 [Nitrospinae bacterium RIFCSPLOWO2_12_FULL_47_7]|nr:MAG: hypothetical protein A3K09_01660 [Nitrospinae bacterium RIFCSPLOWO2_12_FULL_47_7]
MPTSRQSKWLLNRTKDRKREAGDGEKKYQNRSLLHLISLKSIADIFLELSNSSPQVVFPKTSARDAIWS